MKVRSLYRLLFTFLLASATCAVVNIFAARYYRLLEKERKIFLGLRGIDSLAAIEYLHLETATERAQYYEGFWSGKMIEEREQFEERIEYAFHEFGRHAPLSDDRIPVYVKYGPPSRREEITPQKKIAIKEKENVKPAEIWTYRKQGLTFDFVRLTRAYIAVAQSEFGDNVIIPHLSEMDSDTAFTLEDPGVFDFQMTTGRFRQKKNLTRLELYFTLTLEDTTDIRIERYVEVFDREDELVQERNDLLHATGSASGMFFDEVNFWLEPAEYRLEITFKDITRNRTGRRTLWVDLIEYQNDAKEISDLIPARLIDNAFTAEKFDKPVGRVIPLTEIIVPVHQPFYFYAEVYNLETKDGMHQLRTTYEVTNKQKMRREIVDVMIRDQIEAGDVAYLAAQYHPMDLAPGSYIITLRVTDLINGKEKTAISEFELILPGS